MLSMPKVLSALLCTIFGGLGCTFCAEAEPSRLTAVTPGYVFFQYKLVKGECLTFSSCGVP